MAELLADPGFDLIYSRTGSVSIPRDNGPDAITKIRQLDRNIDATTAIVIFPEGRLFRPDRLERTKTRLALEKPARSARLASLSHVLPARPAGAHALVDTIDADVVFIAHTGLDQYASFTELAKAVPLRGPDSGQCIVSSTRAHPGWGRRTNRLARRNWLLVGDRVAATSVELDARPI